MMTMKRVRAWLSSTNPSEDPSLEVINLHVSNKDHVTHVFPPNWSECAEVICADIAKLLKFKPISLPLFQIGYFNLDGGTPKILWVNPKKKLDKGFKFFFRLRFLPNQNVSNFFELDKNAAKYLFQQCHDDIVSDRLNTLWNQQDLLQNDSRNGLTVLALLIEFNMIKSTEKDFEKFFGKIDMEDYLPQSTQKKLNPISRWKLLKEIKGYLKDLQKKKYSVTRLMCTYITQLLDKVPDYFIEVYECQEFENFIEVSINMMQYSDVTVSNLRNAQPRVSVVPGLYINQELFCNFDDLLTVKLEKRNNNATWSVMVNRRVHMPQDLIFISEQTAWSFITGIDGYFRIVKNFYSSLCQEIEPPSLGYLRLNGIHAPISEKLANSKLDTCHQSYPGARYILRKDSDQFYHYWLTLYKADSIKNWHIVDDNGKFKMTEYRGAEPIYFDEISQLPSKLINDLHVLKQGGCVYKPSEGYCDTLQKLFVDDKQLDQETKQSSAPVGPLLYHTSDIEVKDPVDIYCGKFSEMQHVYLKKGIRVLRKKLIKTTAESQLHPYNEVFHNSIDSMMRFQESNQFLKMEGIVLSKTVEVLYEQSYFKSMVEFLQTNGKQLLYLRHLVIAAMQVACGIKFMQEKGLCHGNMCCSNIVVTIFENQEIRVKISDDDMVFLYNSKPLDDQLNLQRLPWIDVEVYESLEPVMRVTKEGDVYAFGTMLWEMFSHGINPLNIDPLKSLSFEQRKTFFKERGKWPLPSVLEDVQKSSEHYDDDDDGDDKMSLLSVIDTIFTLIKDCHKRCTTTDGPPTPQQILSCLDGIFNIEYPIGRGPPTDMIQDCSPNFFPENSTHDPLHCNVSDDNTMIPKTVEANILSPKRIGLKLIKRSQLVFDENTLLGQGNFGKVFKALYHPSDGEPMEVAVKQPVKDGETRAKEHWEKWDYESNMLKKLDDPNIVRFIGQCTTEKLIVMELIKGTSLKNHLEENKTPPNYKKNLGICYDIVKGMCYLSQKNIVHGDLAARNVLLSVTSGAKISDFGLSKFLPSGKDYYKHKNRPFTHLWSSPELLIERRMHIPGDMWSFGIVVWEIWSCGENPNLRGMDTSRPLEEQYCLHLQMLEAGQRLDKPNGCQDDIYCLMMTCWKRLPNQRPTFEIVRSELQKIMKVDVDACPVLQTSASQNNDFPALPPRPLHRIDADRIKEDNNQGKNILGAGHYGEVKKAWLLNETFHEGQFVAIKYLKPQPGENLKSCWSQIEEEAAIMYRLGHPNIVKLIGVCRAKNCLVMEFVNGCSLQHFLCKNKLSSFILHGFCENIATGMSYLQEQKIVHCDLATRNVLIGEEKAKITDFGLSRVLEPNKDYYRASGKNMFPWMWCAPEVLETQKISSEADIWSFGIVVWEIFSKGQRPQLVPDNKFQLKMLQNGDRLKPPKDCPRYIEQLMKTCWKLSPKDRKSFKEHELFLQDHSPLEPKHVVQNT